MRIVFFTLTFLFAAVAFFAGIRVGAWRYKIDNPPCTNRCPSSVPTTSLERYTIPQCSFTFTTPSDITVTVSSSSAQLNKKSQRAVISCVGTRRYTVTGNKDFVDFIRPGFSTELTEVGTEPEAVTSSQGAR